MEKVLNIYLQEKIIGHLKQDEYGDMSFTYSEDWLNDPNAISISCSLPLQKEIFKRKECHAFFGGILPEENQRKIIAKNLGISATNDFSMLQKIGGECAGALSFIPAEHAFNIEENSYQELTNSTLASILRELPTRPLLAGEQDVRLSLAGVQDKLAVHINGDKISIPLNSAPSTHILKPDFNLYEGVIFNEAFCMQLAKEIDLIVAEVELKKIEDINYLLIRRYDRLINGEENTSIITRLHQEDFCQALSIPSNKKYQNEGGPSLKQCFDLLRRESAIPVIDLQKMLDGVIFNYLIGNCDAHGKNFSLLYSNGIQFAPLYDLICTVYYPDISKKMAMKIGGEYHISNIQMANFDTLADEIGFSKPQVKKRIIEMIDSILSVISTVETNHPLQEEIAKLIKMRCENFKN